MMGSSLISPRRFEFIRRGKVEQINIIQILFQVQPIQKNPAGDCNSSTKFKPELKKETSGT
jgi:hypothetical protein